MEARAATPWVVELVAEAHAHAGGEVAEAEDEGFEAGVSRCRRR